MGWFAVIAKTSDVVARAPIASVFGNQEVEKQNLVLGTALATAGGMLA